MAIPTLDPVSGLLPLGRFPADLAEVEARFVAAPQFASSATRPDIWTHFDLAKQALEQLLPVYAVWLGGSFVTSKVDPDDIDVVWLVDGDSYANLTPLDQGVVSVFGTPRALRQSMGWRVDSFLVNWLPFPSPNPGDPRQLNYFWFRGHWDDFWLRMRQGPKGATPTDSDTIPRRGYIEVMLHDYL